MKYKRPIDQTALRYGATIAEFAAALADPRCTLRDLHARMRARGARIVLRPVEEARDGAR